MTKCQCCVMTEEMVNSVAAPVWLPHVAVVAPLLLLLIRP